MSKIKTAFKMDVMRLPLSALVETCPRRNYQTITAYHAILSSYKKFGLLHPISIFQSSIKGKYKILQGHLRFYAVRDSGDTEINCIISDDDERFTQEDKVNAINPIQRAKMLQKAIKEGADIDKIAEALHIERSKIEAEIDATNGIDSGARNILKSAPVSVATLRLLKKVKPVRQIQIAEGMIAANLFDIHYVSGMVISTHESLMNEKFKKKNSKKFISHEAYNTMTAEQTNIHAKVKELRGEYNKNMCELVTIVNFLRKILDNNVLSTYLKRTFEDLYCQFVQVSKCDFSNFEDV